MTEQKLKIVIVGGVAGGASAATRARRCNEHAEIVILEKDEFVSFANCGMPYHIGGEIPDRAKLLVATKEFLERRFRLDVRTMSEAVRIDRKAKCITVRKLDDNSEYDLPYDKLILSPGAAPFVPAMDCTDANGVFTLRNIADMDRIRAAVDQTPPAERKAVVIGAGFIGLEMVEQLVAREFSVSLAELQAQVLPPMDPEMVVPLQEDLVARGVTPASLAERASTLIARLGPLPSVAGVTLGDAMDAVSRDKKVVHGRLHFVLVDGTGATTVSDVTRKELRAALGSVGVRGR